MRGLRQLVHDTVADVAQLMLQTVVSLRLFETLKQTRLVRLFRFRLRLVAAAVRRTRRRLRLCGRISGGRRISRSPDRPATGLRRAVVSPLVVFAFRLVVAFDQIGFAHDKPADGVTNNESGYACADGEADGPTPVLLAPVERLRD